MQDQVGVETALKAVRSGDNPKVSGLEKQFADLQDKYRSLEERLSKVEKTDGAKGRKK
ncbi:MAG: hypothetical protein L6Q71_01445 [Planctomycetes bacterium]|nr:hypothetical protein [Planctomycetota bacterium]NUQ35933.1 hypothetical protein [Planctomycetaceae bacterium]